MSFIHLFMLCFLAVTGIAFTFIKPRIIFFACIFSLMAFNDYIGGLPSSVMNIGGHLFYAADFFLVLLYVAVIRGLWKRDLEFKLDRPVFAIIVVFIAYGILSMVIGAYHHYIYNDIIGDFRRYYYYPLAIFIPMLLLQDSRDIQIVEKAVFVAAPIICVFGFFRIITGQTYFPEVHANPYDQFRAMGFHDYIILIFAICLAMGKTVLRNGKDTLSKAYLLLLPPFVIASNFRIAWALLIMGPLAMLFLLRSKGISSQPLRRTLLLSVLVVILIGGAAKISGSATYQALETRVVDQVLNYTFEESQRDYLWEEVLTKWQVVPWMGIGLGKNVTYVTRSFDGEWVVAQAGSLHNSYLELALKTGIIGLALFLLLQGMLIIRCLKASRQAKLHLPFALAGIVLVISMLIQTGIQPFLTEPNSVVLIYLVIGSILSLSHLKLNHELEGTMR